MIARFRAWLRDLLDGGWDEVDGPTYASDDPCTCSPAAVGPRGSSCPRCGGGVVYLSEHPTDEAARLEAPTFYSDHDGETMYGLRGHFVIHHEEVVVMNCEVLSLRTAAKHVTLRDCGPLPSTADPGVVTDPKEE